MVAVCNMKNASLNTTNNSISIFKVQRLGPRVYVCSLCAFQFAFPCSNLTYCNYSFGKLRATWINISVTKYRGIYMHQHQVGAKGLVNHNHFLVSWITDGNSSNTRDKQLLGNIIKYSLKKNMAACTISVQMYINNDHVATRWAVWKQSCFLLLKSVFSE